VEVENKIYESSGCRLKEEECVELENQTDDSISQITIATEE
jgi:hypothetical protein